jgi:hypothetical protein
MSRKRKPQQQKPPQPEQPPQTLGDAPISDEYRQKMNVIASILDEGFNGIAKGADRKTGFVLLVFPFNDLDPVGMTRCNFISNGADRKDLVTLFKEMIARFEGQPDVQGSA